MGAGPALIIPLAGAGDRADHDVGGKARGLGRLISAGYRVPAGFCIGAAAYEQFVSASGLEAMISMELGRKPLDAMRWEEIWDAALRIRSAFLSTPVAAELADAIVAAYGSLAPGLVVVRSSAPGEDAAARSFAGLHESVAGVAEASGLLDAVRIVWSSLWSDAALLYRRELGLDIEKSRMAVVVQEFMAAPVSGVAFGCDPRAPGNDRQIIEAVPGPCEGLVSGMVDPDRWILARSSGELVSWTPGGRGQGTPEPLLAPDDLEALHRTLRGVESLLGCPPDVEWTGHAPELTLVQARPITTSSPMNADDERAWYLTLRPGADKLADLCERVTQDLIPALAEAGASFAAEELDSLSDTALAEAIVARHQAHEHWKGIYKEQFIPFAHGVRRFGQYYNDALQPADPYAFVALLEHQPMIATARNAALSRLADLVRRHPGLAAWLAQPEVVERAGSRNGWDVVAATLAGTAGGDVFRQEFERFLAEYMDLVFDGESLDERPDLVLDIVRQLADADAPAGRASTADSARIREEQFLAAVGPDRGDEAREVLRVARLSWQLRDDDNVLMGRLRNQLQHALTLAAQRLRSANRLAAAPMVGSGDADALVEGLRNPGSGPVVLPPRAPATAAAIGPLGGATPRQLIGQPASGGLATGRVRLVHKAADFRAFRRGEVMVCDAIQPTMTHLVPLACAIVERRGGMLIHGAIIARELGVPCVNGVADATALLGNGDLVTVDGHLGIVTVGEPDFELEQADLRPG